MKRLLLTGGSGLFGQAFIDLVKKTPHEIYVTYNKHPLDFENAFQTDITDAIKVKQLIEKIKPDIVIHSAAFTNVDRCEIEKEKAYEINAKATENIAKVAKEIDAKLIYISTDYVFDGKKGLYKEGDKTNPINYYGLTKLEGEKAVIENCEDYVIARTSVIYGANKKNFATWVIEELKKGNQIKIITDQWVSPTLNIDLAEQILALIEKNEKGVFHTAGGERISRYDFVLKLAEFFNFDKKLVIPATSDMMNWIAKRPRDSSLNVSKISNIKRPYKVNEALNSLKEVIK
ncbi:dTDP-4-dehydrorhamnose reductase [Thermoplasmatales archaeon ex4484_30]|nr:MAG: dTDP-4-dehydrorhamnose reductase [Thermoplasmatales archaeon ex4484_30]